MSSEKSPALKDFHVSDGDTWSAGKALTVSATVVTKNGTEEKINFANNWDTNVPYAKEWRESLETKIDFSDISLETSPEEISKKKEDILQNYSTSSLEEVSKTLENLSNTGKQYSAESYVHWMYGAVMSGLQISGIEDFEKTLDYAGKIIDNIVDFQNKQIGETPNYENIYNIKSPYRTRLDKILGREGWDPYGIIKDGAIKDFGENAPIVVSGLKKIKDILPKTAEEMGKFDFEKKEEFFAEHFGEEHQSDKIADMYGKQLKGHIVQLAIRDNISKAFDEQLAEHTHKLEQEKQKAELAVKKDEIKARLEERKKSKNVEPLSGVVIADKIAQHIIASKALFDKDKELGIISPDEKDKLLTPKEGNEMAQKIQQNFINQQNSK